MANEFRFSRDFRNVSWAATVQYNMLRAVCAGVVFATVGIIFAMQNPRAGFDVKTPLVLGAALVLGYPIVYMPIGIVLAFMARFFAPISLAAFSFGMMVAIGDPLVFIVQKVFPRFVPVARPAFFSLRMLIFVLKDEITTREERQTYAVATDRREYAIKRAVSPMRDSNESDDVIGEFLTATQTDPVRALAFVDRLSPELRNKSSIAFGRFMALRTLALGNLVGTCDLATASVDEILSRMDRDSTRNAALALQQISELDRLHPGVVQTLVDDDGVHFAEEAIDDVCTIVERIRPGKIQELLGWTKLAYFGSERLAVHKNVKRKNASLRPMLRTRIEADEKFVSAVCLDYSHSSSVAKPTATFVVYRSSIAEVDELSDAGIVGTFRISTNSRYEFSHF